MDNSTLDGILFYSIDGKLIDNLSLNNNVLDNKKEIKTSKEFKSDITGIGKYALRNFTTTSQFEEYNWKDNYKNSFFEVTVDTNVKSGFLIM